MSMEKIQGGGPGRKLRLGIPGWKSFRLRGGWGTGLQIKKFFTKRKGENRGKESIGKRCGSLFWKKKSWRYIAFAGRSGLKSERSGGKAEKLSRISKGSTRKRRSGKKSDRIARVEEKRSIVKGSRLADRGGRALAQGRKNLSAEFLAKMANGGEGRAIGAKNAFKQHCQEKAVGRNGFTMDEGSWKKRKIKLNREERVSQWGARFIRKKKESPAVGRRPRLSKSSGFHSGCRDRER